MINLYSRFSRLDGIDRKDEMALSVRINYHTTVRNHRPPKQATRTTDFITVQNSVVDELDVQ